jgi:CheY-like chemotaxis protein
MTRFPHEANMARILLANDDLDLLELCQSLLEDEGHTVERVINGREALERAQTWLPDLVLLDWVMPELDGGSATKILRANPSTAAIPILMMSGSTDGEEQARDAGADAFLRKPFRAADLLRHIDNLLSATIRAPAEAGSR